MDDIRMILRPEEAIRLAESIGRNGRNTGIKANFIINKLEGKDNYKRGTIDINRLVLDLQELIKLYPNFSDQLNRILSDCNEQYTFRDGIETLEEFKQELNKFYVNNSETVKLMFPKGTSFQNDIYMQLYEVYLEKGASGIQSMIDGLQDVDKYELIEAVDGWRFKDQVIEGQDIPLEHIPSCDELFKEDE